MARGKGYQGIIGLRKAATWGTAVACGATHGIEVLSLDTPGNAQLVDDLSLTGKVTMKPAVAGIKMVDVTFSANLRYEGFETAIALVLGTAGAPATVDTSAKQHTLKLADEFDGIFATLAYEIIKDTTIIELTTVKWISCSFKSGPGKPVELTLKGIAHNYEPASAVNTTTTIDTITLPSSREIAMFQHGVWAMNAQGGGALGGSDVLYVQDWEINIERQMDRLVSTELGDKTSEPITSGFVKVSGSWTFPVLATGTGGNSGLMADQLALTAKKAKLTLTGATLIGAVTQKTGAVFWFPYLQLGEGKPTVGGPGQVAYQQPWQAVHATADPTGFTSGFGSYAVAIDIFSTRSTDSLA
jgi:hypothetical protein